MDIANLIQNIAIYALPVLFAITVHEASHGYAARYFGDNTAWSLGRVTLNPLKHIDPFGTILLPLILVVIGSPIILGAAKPVPVRFDRLRNPKRDMVWVALAGPMANLVMALAWSLAFQLLMATGVTEVFFLEMCKGGVLVNVVLFAFNLFPLPPLDGGRILVGLLPIKQAMLVSRIEPYGFFIVFALFLTGIISSFWMQPVLAATLGLLELIVGPLPLP